MFKIKNNKGFTMVELLAAVTILGILATIAIVSVTNTIEKSHKEYDKKQNKLFTTAAQTYFTDNRSELPKKLLTTNTVTLQKLIEENYIEEIVDYKKKAYDKEKSVATVKKTGAGKYMYYSTLVSGDGKRKPSDAPDTNNKTGKVNIKINKPNLVNTDMKSPLTEYGKKIYYVNKEITIPVVLTGTSGISSYQYRIDKLSTVSSSSGKKYKISGEIAVDNTSFNDTITINAKDFANGIYRLSVNAYGYQAEGSTKDASYIIVIDKTKPKCTIEMSREPNGNKVEGDTFGNKWYKAGNLSAIMKITEKNKYKYTLGFDEMQYNIEYRYNNTKEEEILPITQNIINKYVYGYLQDKAGNVGECKTEKPIYYDNTVPTCKINISGGNYHSDTGWYWDDISLSLARYDDNGNNQSEQGDNESGVYQYDMSTNNFKADQITTYTNCVNHPNCQYTQSEETKGTTWYGYLQDKAGNQGKCQTATLKLDKTNPTCTSSVKSGTKGNNGWYTSNVGIQGSCSDTASGSGCKSNSTNTITGEGENLTGTLGNVCDNSGRCSACNSITVSIELNGPDCWSFSSSEDGWTNNDYVLDMDWTPSVSGNQKLYREDNTCDNNTCDISVLSNATYYKSNPYSNETNRNVCYYVVSNAGKQSKCGCQQIKIDKTPPTHKEECYCESIKCASCTAVEPYVLKMHLTDSASGLKNGDWTWASDGSETTNRTSNPTYSGASHYGFIGVSTKGGLYTYNLCDVAGNCTGTQSKHVNASSECSGKTKNKNGTFSYSSKYCKSHDE